ncbi:helix-turn-helix domain-containing protein [Luedemannella flava]
MDSWEQRLTSSIATAIRYWRDQRGMTAKDVEAATWRLGHRVPKSVIVNLENRRRESISVAELLIVAAALEVPPILLLAPLGRSESVEVLPDIGATPWQVRGWVHGAFVPPYEGLSYERWRYAQIILGLHDVHRALVKRYMNAEERLRLIARSLPDLMAVESPDEAVATVMRRYRIVAQDLAGSLNELRDHRNSMEEDGFLLPELPSAIEEALIAGSEVISSDVERQIIQDMLLLRDRIRRHASLPGENASGDEESTNS